MNQSKLAKKRSAKFLNMKKYKKFEVCGNPLDKIEPYWSFNTKTKKIAEFDDEEGLYSFLVQQSSSRRFNQTVVERLANGKKKKENAVVVFDQLRAENPELKNLKIVRTDTVEQSSKMLSQIVGLLSFDYLNQNTIDDIVSLANARGYDPEDFFSRKDRLALLKNFIEYYDPGRPDLEIINYFHRPPDEILKINNHLVWIYPNEVLLYNVGTYSPECDSFEGYILNRLNALKESSDKRFFKKRLNKSDKNLLRLADDAGFSCTYAGDVRTIHLPKNIYTTDVLVEKFR